MTDQNSRCHASLGLYDLQPVHRHWVPVSVVIERSRAWPPLPSAIVKTKVPRWNPTQERASIRHGWVIWEVLGANLRYPQLPRSLSGDSLQPRPQLVFVAGQRLLDGLASPDVFSEEADLVRGFDVDLDVDTFGMPL